MAGAKVIDFVGFRTHRTETEPCLLVHEVIRDTTDLAGEVQHGLAILVRRVGRRVVANTLEIRGGVLNGTEREHSFHHKFRRITLNPMAQS